MTGFLISALGGSKTQIGGPTGAFVVVISGIIAAHGIDGLFMCTVMAGVLLVILGATGMGTAVKFIPRPVVFFTNGIAVLIASTQIKDYFGLHLQKVPGEFWLRLKALAASAPTWSWQATMLAACTVAIMLGAREQPAQLIHQAEFEEVVGRENICSNVEEALRRAEDVFENIKPMAAKTGG